MNSRGNSRIKSVISVIPSSLLISATIFILAPSLIYLGNVNEFKFGLIEILASYFLPFLIVNIVLTFIAVALPLSFAKRYTSIVFIIGLLTWLHVNFFVRDYGVFDGSLINWSNYSSYIWFDMVLLIGTLFAGLYYFDFTSRLVTVASYTILGLSSLFVVHAWFISSEKIQQDNRVSSLPSGLFKYSKNKNIIHILMDHFQTDIFHELIRENKWDHDLSGFTLYRDNIAAPVTYLSLPALFSGRAYDGSTSAADFYTTSIKNDNFTNVLYTGGYAVNVVSYFPFPNANVSNYYRVPNTYGGTLQDEKRFEAAYLMDVSLFRSAPQPLKKLIYNNNNWRITGMFSVPSNIQAISELSFLKDYTQNITLSLNEPAYHFIGLEPPHPPYVMNKDGSYAGVLSVTRENYKNQARHTLVVVMEYLTKLKELNVYEDSLIILQSDHGSEFPPVINGESIDIGRPRVPGLLAIKPPKAEGEIKVSDLQTSITDVASTIIGFSGLQWSNTRDSIFELRESMDRERFFNGMAGGFKVVGSIYERNSWKQITYQRFKDNHPDPYVWGSVIQFGVLGNAARFKKDGWSTPREGVEWTNGYQATMDIPVLSPDGNIFFEIKGMPFVSPGKLERQRMRLIVNGIQQAEWSMDEFRLYTHSVVVQQEHISDHINLVLEFPDATRPSDLDISPDGRLLGMAVNQLTMKVQ